MDKKSKLKHLVIKTYSSIASQGSCCAMPATCCSHEIKPVNLLETGRLLGYSDEELKIGLGEANLGLGCGNPFAIAELKEGETVLDLGSGAGFDAFLSAMKAGPDGYVKRKSLQRLNNQCGSRGGTEADTRKGRLYRYSH